MDLRKIMKCSTRTGVTVFSMLLVLVIQFLLSISPDIVTAAAFDDFSNDKIDSSKWSQQELVRVVEDEKLSMAIRHQTDKNSEYEVETVFKDPASITKMQARVVVSAYQLDPDIITAEHQLVGAEMYGSYIGSTDGDVEAGILILDRNDGQGLRAVCWYSSDGDEFEKHEFFPMSIETGHPYILAIEYKEAEKTFTYSITDGNDSNITEPIDLDHSSPEISGPPNDEEKALAVWYEIEDEIDGTFDAEGSISVTFDDIKTDGAPYDDFSSNDLDSSKWDSVESERRITDNSLKLSQHNDGSPSYKQVMIHTADDVSTTDYYQASILVDSTSSVSGTKTGGQATMSGSFYNDLANGGTNYMVGEHIVMINLMLTPGNVLVAESHIFRCNTVDCSNTTPVFTQNFSNTPSVDTPYTVSIQKSGKSLLFTMDGEEINYMITGDMFTPFRSLRGMDVGVWSDTDENGTMVAFFDNVYFEKPTSPWALFLPAILTSARNNK